MRERRKTTRYVENNKAVINISVEKGDAKRDPTSIRTQDLSIDGAKLITPQMLMSETRLVISLDLPKSKQVVKLWARVVWAQKLNNKKQYAVGVEFIHSRQTIPNLFQHLYGYRVQTKKMKLPKQGQLFPVDFADA